ncbi:MAG: CPBP family intramembrane glutamic endopeptidase [Acidobacteriaceae bacterium]
MSEVEPNPGTVDARTSEPQPITPTPLRHRMFIGPNGLRAGWSLAIYGLIVAACLTMIHFSADAIHAYLRHGKPPVHPSRIQIFAPGPRILQELLLLLCVLLAAWIMSRIEKRPFGEYGLGGNSRRLPQFLQGFCWGFAFISLLILSLYLGHYIVLTGIVLHGFRALEYALAWMVFFLLVGVFEEFFFRGYIQYTLARGIGYGAVGFWISAILWNFGFGFVHSNNSGESPIGLFQAGFIGLIFCLSLWYTRSLWWAIGAHATWDWGESYFYGTADSGMLSKGHLLGSHPQGGLLMSGGATGPEGSVISIVVAMLIALVIWLTLRKERDKSTRQALVNPLT